jgi:hypothetical protein
VHFYMLGLLVLALCFKTLRELETLSLVNDETVIQDHGIFSTVGN